MYQSNSNHSITIDYLNLLTAGRMDRNVVIRLFHDEVRQEWVLQLRVQSIFTIQVRDLARL